MAVSDLIDDIANKIWPSQDEKLKNAELIAQLKALPSAQAMQLKMDQSTNNNSEAQNGGIFVAGWRPFIGWACGIVTVINLIGFTLSHWFGFNYYQIGDGAPEQILMQLLGLNSPALVYMGLRTYEKTKGVS